MYMSRPTNETPSVKSYNPSPGGRLHMNKANMQMHTNDDAFHLAHIFLCCGQSQGPRPFSMNLTAHWVSPRHGSTLRHPLSLVMTSCHDLCLDVQSMSPAVLPPFPHLRNLLCLPLDPLQMLIGEGGRHQVIPKACRISTCVPRTADRMICIPVWCMKFGNISLRIQEYPLLEFVGL